MNNCITIENSKCRRKFIKWLHRSKDEPVFSFVDDTDYFSVIREDITFVHETNDYEVWFYLKTGIRIHISSH